MTNLDTKLNRIIAVSEVGKNASVYTVMQRWERSREDAASRHGPRADVAVATFS